MNITPIDTTGPSILPLFGEKENPKFNFLSTTIPLYISFLDESGINKSNLSPSELPQVQVNDNPPQGIYDFFIAESGSFKKEVWNFR
jgi:hypothetical protein